MTPRTAGRTAALSCAAVLLAAACGAGPRADTGPLGNGGSKGGVCLPDPSGRVLSWGITVLRNNGQSRAVIEKVTLLGADNLRLTASYVVPITGNTDYGAWPGYPPAPPQPGVNWSQHAPAAGAAIPAQTSRTHSNLVTVLKPTGHVAKARAIEVLYHEEGTQYRLVTHTRLVFLVGARSCPDNWDSKYPP